MRAYDFENSIGYWVCTTSHIYQRRIDRELTTLGITFRQFQVLAWLALEGELGQADLAERMMIEPPTLVRILDRMQSQGLVRRTASETDRRRKRIEIDQRAEPVWDQVVDCLKRVRREATAQMSEQEVATLQDLLQRMQRNLTRDLPDEETAANTFEDVSAPFSPHSIPATQSENASTQEVTRGKNY